MGQFTVKANRLGFKGFSEKCELVYKLFKLYGESVLEVEFNSSDKKEEKLRELFSTVSPDNFSEEIRKFWNDYYTFIIKKPSDFNSVPVGQKDILVSEVYPYRTAQYKIAKNLYDKLYTNRHYSINNSVYYSEFSYVLGNDFLYAIKVYEDDSISLESKIPLSNIVTE